MPLLNLPNEILLHISENSDELRDLNNLLRCNRCLYALLNDTLYRLALEPVGPLTALEWAVDGGYEHLVRSLLLSGVDIESGRKPKEICTRETPLIRACKNGNLSIAKLLLQHGADAKIQFELGSFGYTTLLHYIILRDITEELRNDFIRLLLSYGADVDVQDNCGNTPLQMAMVAYYRGPGWRFKIGRLLCEHGANVQIQNSRGMTPLHSAVIVTARWKSETNRVALITLLLEKGADSSIKNGNGDTPLSIARQYKLKCVVKTLLGDSVDVREVCSERKEMEEVWGCGDLWGEAASSEMAEREVDLWRGYV